MLLNMTLHVTLVSSAGHCYHTISFDTEPVGQLCINVHELRLRANRSILVFAFVIIFVLFNNLFESCLLLLWHLSTANSSAAGFLQYLLGDNYSTGISIVAPASHETGLQKYPQYYLTKIEFKHGN